MQEQSIFIEALEREAPAERELYLDQVCAGDPLLRQRIDRLLKRHREADGFLEAPVYLPVNGGTVTSLEGPGTLIGPYKLLEQIGEGGFGLVFLAEQQHPVRRKVALKVLKPGMDSKQVIARFEAERQALALMDHPNIARVLEAGETPSGRPHFVMELVRGEPITEYCDQNGLPTEQRLELFASVCAAVQHAHQKGIIHRDIKPSNVLVTLHDDKPVVKVIDFGIAKAIGQSLTDKTLNTGFAQMIGTPLYMSPEQAQMSDHDVDTRTDVYSLGVLLYELLTGTTPFDKDRLRETSYDEMRRIIREEDPPRPSTRFSTLGQTASTACARQRQSDPRRLSRLLRGELDWIVMRALEKDRNRRYESAGAFAADLQRHLHGEPIMASPPSALYRVRKLAWRHRGKLLMAASGLAALLISVAAIAAGLGWVASDRATRDAALDAHVQITLDEAVSLLETGKWPEAPASLERAEKLLDAAGRAARPMRLGELRRDLAMAQRLEDIYTNPATEVPIVGHHPKDMAFAKIDDRAYADAFAEYGIDVRALSVAEAAGRIQASSIRQDLARALDQWSGLRRQAKRREPDWQHLLEIAKTADPDPWRNRLRTALQSDDRKTLEALAASADVRQLPAGTLALLGRTLAGYLGSPDQAVALLQQAQRQYPRDLWINIMLGWYCSVAVSPHRYEDAARYFGVAVSLRPHSPFLRNCLGRALLWKKAYQECLAEFSKAIELEPTYAAPWFNRGVALAHLKEWDSALASCREAIRLDPQHAGARSSFAVVLEMQGSFAEAEKAFREALRLKPDNAGYHYKLGELLARQQSYSEAEGAYREAVRLHPDNSGYQFSLGLALSRQHKYPEAELAYREAIGLKPTYRAHANLGAALQQQSKHGEAEMAYRESIRLKPDYIWAIDHLGWLLATCADPKVRKPQEARDLGERAVAFNPKVGHYWNMLAAARYRSGDFKGAIAAGEKAMTLNRGGDSIEWFFLAMSHARLGYREKAKGYYERAVKWMDEHQPDNVELRRFKAEASELIGMGSKK